MNSVFVQGSPPFNWKYRLIYGMPLTEQNGSIFSSPSQVNGIDRMSFIELNAFWWLEFSLVGDLDRQILKMEHKYFSELVVLPLRLSQIIGNVSWNWRIPFATRMLENYIQWIAPQLLAKLENWCFPVLSFRAAQEMAVIQGEAVNSHLALKRDL